MSLEHILKPNITNFSELRPAEPRPENSIMQKFIQLKNSGIYDKDKQLWKPRLNKSARKYHYFIKEQLIGIWLETFFNNKRAQEDYENKIKKMGMTDPMEEPWNRAISSYPLNTDHTINTKDLLLAILIEGLFDKNNAQNQHNYLKKTSLKSLSKLPWRARLKSEIIKGKEQIITSSERETGDQLLGILIEAMFDKEISLKSYQKMQTTSVFDPDNKQWKQSNASENTNLVTDDQLLGILVESIFNKDRARKLFSIVREKYYDETTQQWIKLLPDKNATKSVVTNPHTSPQLLGLIVEKTLESGSTLTSRSPLPVVRRF